ncbi:hypothetical protein OO013_10315 [Mangrovivirga sp. M17]|uniref:Uncharacterized protein n=1 Tax=Mangrovivirga halotolerans TaxID=2993936 RepID=A0ABT3RSP4_9BACT|nr:hypothetical protein [Mangrovivirga halotolerans]MCX2744262.1 hypothetical protein [Mangrovivirga halotolerans]
MDQINCWKSEHLLLIKLTDYKKKQEYDFYYFIIDPKKGDSMQITINQFDHLLEVLETNLLENDKHPEIIEWVKWKLQKHIYSYDDLYMV